MSHNHPGQCFPGSRDCWLEENSEKHREHFLLWRKGQTPANDEGFRVSLPCVFRGPQVYPPFAPDNVKTYYRCDNGFGVVCECAQCNSACRGYALADRLRVYDSSNAWPEVHGTRFNASIVRWQNRWLFAFRNRQWESEIWIGQLDEALKPIGRAVKLMLDARECRHGADDPRFFIHQDRLHVAFVGIERQTGSVTCSMGFVSLDDDLWASKPVFPNYDRRNRVEKNWQFFSLEGKLFAVYTIAPHRVLEVVGSEARTSFLTSTRAEWHGGELRGGASPVLVGDRFYSFFHSSVTDRGRVVYNVGVYTFEASPPFRVLGLTPRPILWASDNGEAPAKSVVFPCGAHLDRGVADRWIVAGGRDDRIAELWEFAVDDVDASIVSVTTSPAVEGSHVPTSSYQEDLEICLSIDGWSDREKLGWISRECQTLRPSLALEIGVWRGRVLVLLGRLLAKLNAVDLGGRLAIGVDPYDRESQVEGCTDPEHLEWSQKIDWDSVHLDALANVRRHCPSTAVLLRTSSSVTASILRAPIDFIHIDGCHSERQALADVSAYLPLLSRSGILILDDVDWSSVKPAQRFLQERCELIHDGGTWQAFRPV